MTSTSPATTNDLAHFSLSSVTEDHSVESDLQIPAHEAEFDNESDRSESLDEDSDLDIMEGQKVVSYPPPGHLVLHTVNPLDEPIGQDFAPTANLSYDLQLWWQFYHDQYIQDDDQNLWAMATVISDTRELEMYESIHHTLIDFIEYKQPILGPGQARFFIVRFQSLAARERLRTDDCFDRGVYVESTDLHTTAILIYNLDPVIPDNPPMSSLLMSVTGLPFRLHDSLISELVHGSLWSQTSNDDYKITAIRELSTKPIRTFDGGRVFEVIFKRHAAYKWFALLASPNEFLHMAGWDHQGNQTESTMISRWSALPSCEHCGASSHKAAHRAICPYITIRDSKIEKDSMAANSDAQGQVISE